MSNKTLGQVLDEYLQDTHTVESVYIYHDKQANPHVVLTLSEQDYDYTEVFSWAVDLNAEIEEKQNKITQLNSHIRTLERTKKSVEKAIGLIAKNSGIK